MEAAPPRIPGLLAPHCPLADIPQLAPLAPQLGPLGSGSSGSSAPLWSPPVCGPVTPWGLTSSALSCKPANSRPSFPPVGCTSRPGAPSRGLALRGCLSLVPRTGWPGGCKPRVRGPGDASSQARRLTGPGQGATLAPLAAPRAPLRTSSPQGPSLGGGGTNTRPPTRLLASDAPVCLNLYNLQHIFSVSFTLTEANIGLRHSQDSDWTLQKQNRNYKESVC